MGDTVTKWYVTRTTADEVPAWHTLPGDPRSGPLPSMYKSATLLRTDRTALVNQARLRSERAIPAVAYAIGRRVLVGHLHGVTGEQGPEFAVQDLDDVIEASMRRGSGDVKVTMGVHDPEPNVFDIACAGVTISEAHVDVDDLRARFPGAHHL